MDSECRRHKSSKSGLKGLGEARVSKVYTILEYFASMWIQYLHVQIIQLRKNSKWINKIWIFTLIPSPSHLQYMLTASLVNKPVYCVLMCRVITNFIVQDLATYSERTTENTWTFHHLANLIIQTYRSFTVHI